MRIGGVVRFNKMKFSINHGVTFKEKWWRVRFLFWEVVIYKALPKRLEA